MAQKASKKLLDATLELEDDSLQPEVLEPIKESPSEQHETPKVEELESGDGEEIDEDDDAPLAMKPENVKKDKKFKEERKKAKEEKKKAKLEKKKAKKDVIDMMTPIAATGELYLGYIQPTALGNMLRSARAFNE